MNVKIFNKEVLYYPTIEIQDSTWLKASLCFWDKIYRIVPIDYKPNDTGEVDIAVKNGVVEDIKLNEKDLEQTYESFSMFIEKLQIIPSGFKSSTYEVKLHQDKVDQRLNSFFNSFNGNTDKEGFYRVPNTISNGYMFYLANTVSKRRKIPKITDDKDMFAAMSYIDVNGRMGENIFDKNAKEVYTNLILDYLIPADIESYSIESIIKRNEKLADSKSDFRKIVSEFTDEISKIEDVDFIKKRIIEFKDSITEQKKNYLEILREFSTNLNPAIIYVGFVAFAETWINAFSRTTDDIMFFETIKNGIEIATVATISKIGEKINKSLNCNNSNYYIDLCKKSNENNSFGLKHWRMDRLIDEFVND